MKVKATKTGFYGFVRVYEGDVFEIEDEKAFSSKWMEKIDGRTKKAQSEKATEPKAESPVAAREVI